MTHTDETSLEQQAHSWAVRLSSDDIDKEGLDAFNAWKNQSIQHANAFLAADKAWQSMAQLSHLKAYAKLPVEPVQPSWSERLLQWLFGEKHPAKSFGLIAAAATMIIAVVVVTFPQPNEQLPAYTQQFATAQGNIETFTLKDGSQITLGAQSRVHVEFTQALRKVSLAQGEALFDVTHDAKRPFVVITGSTETRVLGTVFSVQRTHDEVFVAVKEGKVRVGAEAENTQTSAAILTPGQGVTADHQGHTQAVTTVAIDTIGSWKDGKLIFDNAMLEDIIHNINRYSKQRIILVDKQLAKTHLSLTVTLNNIDQFVTELTELLPLKASYNSDAILLSKE